MLSVSTSSSKPGSTNLGHKTVPGRQSDIEQTIEETHTHTYIYSPDEHGHDNVRICANIGPLGNHLPRPSLKSGGDVLGRSSVFTSSIALAKGEKTSVNIRHVLNSNIQTKQDITSNKGSTIWAPRPA